MNYNSIFLKHENNACLGLEDGRCGLVLLAFLLSEKNEKYKETGLLHLNYLLKHVYESSCLSFKKGLLGIGWTLEFLKQNSLTLKSGNESLLSEIDDVIYKWVNFCDIKNFSINDGYLGCLLYLCYRLKGNRITTPYRELSLKECTVRVLGRIYCEITKQEPLLSETEWIQLHVLMGLFKRMNIQNHISDNILHITRSMLKKNNYTLKEQKSNTFTTYIYSLSKTSTRYKVIKNFFV
ncbi:hypothetical protein [Phocaeicola coprophilus]|uniref:hypothetical protein n=1 Tax=Phocaeicola coprophilus TaxID=387090 RepID=UPI00266B86CB|nr:hypothetical protein [Phocaeicola coprophilus]